MGEYVTFIQVMARRACQSVRVPAATICQAPVLQRRRLARFHNLTSCHPPHFSLLKSVTPAASRHQTDTSPSAAMTLTLTMRRSQTLSNAAAVGACQ
jgi:hypothetical protein